MDRKGKIIIISAPSGCGKTTICHELEKARPEIEISISATTRKPRKGEKQGKDYYFFTEEEFKKKIRSGYFAEWASVYHNYYGTPKEFLEQCIKENKTCLLDIDIQGGMSIKKAYQDAVSFFIIPPSLEELERRLKARGTEKDEDVKMRLENAKSEMEFKKYYDYILVNDSVEGVVKKIIDIINK
ncbi:MAG: guanylate kinase [bacterium]|nr:guanylate kinase [bacterium]